MNKYNEVKTIINQYEAHNRVIDICVKEFKYDIKFESYVDSLMFSFLHIKDPVITVGIAICNPEDDYNEQTGHIIAEGRADKALKKESQLMYKAMSPINDKMSGNKFILSQIADTAFYHFKHNPQYYIHNFENGNKEKD